MSASTLRPRLMAWTSVTLAARRAAKVLPLSVNSRAAGNRARVCSKIIRSALVGLRGVVDGKSRTKQGHRPRKRDDLLTVLGFSTPRTFGRRWAF